MQNFECIPSLFGKWLSCVTLSSRFWNIARCGNFQKISQTHHLGGVPQWGTSLCLQTKLGMYEYTATYDGKLIIKWIEFCRLVGVFSIKLFLNWKFYHHRFQYLAESLSRLLILFRENPGSAFLLINAKFIICIILYWSKYFLIEIGYLCFLYFIIGCLM